MLSVNIEIFANLNFFARRGIREIGEIEGFEGVGGFEGKWSRLKSAKTDEPSESKILKEKLKDNLKEI